MKLHFPGKADFLFLLLCFIVSYKLIGHEAIEITKFIIEHSWKIIIALLVYKLAWLLITKHFGRKK
jgi:hypothetical protein